MTRTSLPVGVAVVVAAGLLLSACGGGGSGSSDKIRSSDAPSASATASSASPSATDGVKRPSTALPKGFTITFDWPKTGDPTKDAVLNDGEQYILGLNRAAALSDVKDPAYQFYSRDQGLTYARTQINANIKGGWVPTGLDKYYRAKVSVTSGSATLTYCEDQSQAFSKEVKTGKVDRTTPSDNSFVLYNALFVKDGASNGVWQASHILVVERAVAQCKE